MTLIQALMRNVGTCRPDAKGDVQVGGPHEDQSTDAGHRGGAARSRDEGPVMGLTKGAALSCLGPWSTGNGKSHVAKAKPSYVGWTSGAG